LETESTAIKRFQHPPPAFLRGPFTVVNFAAFLPPGSLTLGAHELRTVLHDPTIGDFGFTTPFAAVSC
jgi:hypothetical protein